MFCLLQSLSAQQFTVSAPPTGTTPSALIQQRLAGAGVSLSGGSFNGSTAAITSSQIGVFNSGNSQFPINTGIVMTTGNRSSVAQSSSSFSGDPMASGASDPQLAAIATNTLNDKAVLDFTFVAFSDTFAFNYVFASEEYPQYVCSSYNDVFGFFVTGVDPVLGTNRTWNVALIPNSVLPVSINTVNGGVSAGSASPCVLTNTQYYHTNTSYPVFNGYTVKLAAASSIMACREYQMHLAIADAGDQNYDSGVFLEDGSFYSPSMEMDTVWNISGFGDTMVQNCRYVDVTFRLPRPVLSGNYHAELSFPTDHANPAAVGYDYGVKLLRATDTVTLNSNSNTYYYQQGDSVVRLRIAVLDTANLGGIIKEARIIITTIFCEDYYYAGDESAGRVDTLVFHLKSNDRIVLADTIFEACYACNHISVPLVSGTEPLIYKWAPVTGLTNPNARETDADIQQNRTYTVIAKDQYGCLADTAQVQVRINERPVANAIVDPTYGCVPLTLNLSAPGVPATCDFRWVVSQDTLVIEGDNPQFNPVLTTPGSYNVTLWVASAPGCEDSVAFNDAVYVSEAPHANFYFVPEDPQNGKDVEFYNQTPETNIRNYHWDFGDGTSSSEENPVHKYRLRESKYMTVHFMVTNEYGCSDDTSAVVPVTDKFAFYVPSAFSPNGDGKNEVFQPKVRDVDFYQLDIFTRTGEMIFHTTDPEEGWDGNLGGRPAAPGVYVWKIQYSRVFNATEIIPKEGIVTLLR